jgi:hypothetical protein
MISFREIRSEMRETAICVTHPSTAVRLPPARIIPEPEEGDEADTHIEPWMEIAFKGLTRASETGEPYALISCLMNGQPAALIAATQPQADGMHVLPLFMAVQPGMHFTPHGGDGYSDGELPDG